MKKSAHAKAFIVASAVRPGDIVLETSGSNDLPTWAIRLRTGSRYTHAKMFVTRLGTLEVGGPGQEAKIDVGPIISAPGRGLLIELGSPDAIVLRVRDHVERRWRRTCGLESVERETPRAVRAYLGREYAGSRDIRGVVPWPLRTAVGRYLDQSQQDGLIRRWFCSSLVAQVYEDIELPLRRGGFQTITPGRIRRSCRLKKVASAIVRLTPAEITASTRVHDGGEVSGHATVRALQEIIDRAKALAQAMGVPFAVEQTEAEIDRMLKKPIPDYAALLALEHDLLGG